MKSFVLSLVLLMVTTSNAFADGPGGGGTVGSDSVDKCVATQAEKLKSSFSANRFYNENFQIGYQISVDVDNAFDPKAKRDIIEFVFTYETKFPTGGVLPGAGYALVFADTCQVISSSGSALSSAL